LGQNVAWGNLDYVLRGMAATVRLSLVAAFLAVTLGVFAGIARMYAPRLLRPFVVAYIEVFRGTPVLVQMFFMFFGLPLVLGLNMSAFNAAALALVMNSGAYFAEITRGGIQSIPQGQLMAGLSQGLTVTQVLRYIVIPQAIRRIIPPAVGQFTILVKDTSVASVIGFFEMTRAGQHIVERTLAPFEIFTLVAVLYFAVCYTGSWASRRLEVRLAYTGPAGTMRREYVLGAG